MGVVVTITILNSFCVMLFQNGGAVLIPDEYEGPWKDYAITLLDEQWFYHHSSYDVELPSDTFSSLYVYSAVKALEEGTPRPDLRKFRVSPSGYQNFDVNKVLDQEMKWSELEEVLNTKPKESARSAVEKIKGLLDKQRMNPNRTATAVNKNPGKKVVRFNANLEVIPEASETEESEVLDAREEELEEEVIPGTPEIPNQGQMESSSSEDEDFVINRNGRRSPVSSSNSRIGKEPEGRLNESLCSIVTRPSSRRKKTRTDYTHDEDMKIIQLIVKHNAYLYTCGNALWEQMAVSKVRFKLFEILNVFLL